jgi:hypothetical protein
MRVSMSPFDIADDGKVGVRREELIVGHGSRILGGGNCPKLTEHFFRPHCRLVISYIQW